jgi:hypothetical protein
MLIKEPAQDIHLTALAVLGSTSKQIRQSLRRNADVNPISCFAVNFPVFKCKELDNASMLLVICFLHV